MMDLNQRGETARARHPGRGEDPDVLRLLLTPNGMPKMVYVKDMGGQVPGFSTDGKNFHALDLEWHPFQNEAYDLFITFILLNDIQIARSVPLPTILLSAPFESGTRQEVCAPRGVAPSTTYSFRVLFPSGRCHDPKIVVTPQ